MTSASEDERKKIKEIKKASETESFEDDDNEAMEDSPESFGLEEELSGTSCLFSPNGSVKSPHTFATIQPSAKDEITGPSVADANEERKRKILQEKWLNLSGKVPKNFPKVRKCRREEDESKAEEAQFFGDRKPGETEKQRKLKWMKMIAEEIYTKKPINYGVLTSQYRLYVGRRGLLSVRFERNGRFLSTAFRDGVVQVRSPFTGRVLRKLESIESSAVLPVRAIRFHPLDGEKLYIGGASGIVQVFDVNSTTPMSLSENIAQINNFDFNADGTVLVAVGRKGKVTILDPETLQVIHTRMKPSINENTNFSINENFHTSRIYYVGFHPSLRNVFATAGWDKVIKAWDVRTPEPTMSIYGPYICGESVDLQEKVILSGSWCRENSLQLWQFPSGKLLKNIPIQSTATKFEGEFLYACQFFKQNIGNYPPNTNLIAVGGNGFNEVNVIKASDGKILASFPTYKATLTLDTLGGYIAYGGTESLFRMGRIVLPHKY